MPGTPLAVRENWGTRIGFIAAAISSAVGLGNIWRFPYEAASNGGAAFLLVNFLLVVAIDLPAMLVELSIGRRAHRIVVDAYARGGRIWKLAGAFASRLLPGSRLILRHVIGGEGPCSSFAGRREKEL